MIKYQHMLNLKPRKLDEANRPRQRTIILNIHHDLLRQPNLECHHEQPQRKLALEIPLVPVRVGVDRIDGWR